MKDPLISIIIPVYNTEKYLPKCLNSIINQTYQNLEIIVIDDGSTDGSLSICQQFAGLDDRIILKHQKNAGVSSARNLGLSLFTGEYISIVDSDDWLEEDTYEVLINIISSTKVDAIIFEYYVDYEANSEVHMSRNMEHGFQLKEHIMEYLFTTNSIAWNKFFSSRCVDKLRFEVNIHRGEDGLFVLKAMENSNSFFYLSKPFYHYVQRSESAVRGLFNPNQLSGMKAYKEFLDFYSRNYPHLLKHVYKRNLHFIICLETDMFVSKFQGKKVKKRLYRTYRNIFCKNIFQLKMTKKELMKFIIFLICPKIYFLFHKSIKKNNS